MLLLGKHMLVTALRASPWKLFNYRKKGEMGCVPCVAETEQKLFIQPFELPVLWKQECRS